MDNEYNNAHYRKYYNENKEKESIRTKKYFEENKDYCLERNKEYRKNSPLVQCKCGSIFKLYTKSFHLKTQKHFEYKEKRRLERLEK